MTKFVVYWEDLSYAITNTEADAEEYILSLAEENAYKMFYLHTNYVGHSIERYMKTLRQEHRSIHFENIYALALSLGARAIGIEECFCLE